MVRSFQFRLAEDWKKCTGGVVSTKLVALNLDECRTIHDSPEMSLLRE
jgi:hypothetical protein